MSYSALRAPASNESLSWLLKENEGVDTHTLTHCVLTVRARWVSVEMQQKEKKNTFWLCAMLWLRWYLDTIADITISSFVSCLGSGSGTENSRLSNHTKTGRPTSVQHDITALEKSLKSSINL